MEELQTYVTGTLNLFYSSKLNQAAEQFWQKYYMKSPYKLVL